jgi:sec-independent protein translocase protein TatA
MRLPQGFEWLILVALVLLLFGAKRLPDAARGLGRSLRIFKAETKGLTDGTPDEKPDELPAATDVNPAPAPAPKDVPAPERTEG